MLMEKSGQFEIVGEAENGRALIKGVASLRPDLVVTDLGMEDLNGIEAIRQLRTKGYAGTIVVFSHHDGSRFVSSAIEAGANAYVHKKHALQHILHAIEAARKGEKWISPHLLQSEPGKTVRPLSETLSQREREVLQLLAEGNGTKEAAAKIGISHKTVEVHRASLYLKLRVNNVSDLTRIAIKEGVVQL
jgi:DNA-binding NarL/FixJ family response regulator